MRVSKISCTTLRGVKTLSNLSEKDYEKVKADLTFPNPQYENVKRFSKYSYTTVPPYISYYRVSSTGVEVPIGYNEVETEQVKDFRRLISMEPPEFKLTLREDQESAVKAYLLHNTPFASASGMVQMPTGKGKSIVGLCLAYKLKQKTLIIVHKTDLVKGWMADAKLSFGDELKCGLIGNGKKQVGDFITIATIQTLNKLPADKLNKLYNEFGFVIIDECHHVPANTYNIVNNFCSRFKLGLTATPERKDGLSRLMTLFLGDFCFKCENKSGDSDILPVDVIVKKSKAFCDPICSVFTKPSGAKSYVLKDLYAPESYKLADDEIRLSSIPFSSRPKVSYLEVEDFVVKQKAYMDMVINDIVAEVKQKHSCIVFFRQKDHCSLYYYRLIKLLPESLVQIYNGNCTNKQLSECLSRAESKEALVTLTTFSKSTEGTNVRAWEVEFLVGSTNDGKSAEQAVGRIRRTKSGKMPVARLYDYNLYKVPMLAKHIHTRVQRYQKLGFNISGFSQKSQPIFTYGYKKT